MKSCKWLAFIGICFYANSAFSQGAASPTTIEVEAQATITFSPDSFVVKFYFDRSSVNYSNSENIEMAEDLGEMPVMVEMSDVDFSREVVEAPPEPEPVKTPEMLRKERERQRMIQDSLAAVQAMRTNELMAKLSNYGVRFPKFDINDKEARYSSRSNTWVQCLSPRRYTEVDSLSRLYGHPLHLEMIDIRMKDHAVLKERAYRQAIENSKKEADALAKAMNRKVGKMTSIKTEAIDVMDLVPLMLRKEIQREIRKSDRFMQPALYQLSQELGTELFEKDRYDERKMIYWTWTEKIQVSYQVN